MEYECSYRTSKSVLLQDTVLRQVVALSILRLTRGHRAAQSAKIRAQKRAPSYSSQRSQTIKAGFLNSQNSGPVLLPSFSNSLGNISNCQVRGRMFMCISLLLERSATPRKNYFFVLSYLKTLVPDQQKINHPCSAAKFLNMTKISFYI